MTTKGTVGIKVNEDIGHYFQTRKGVRQGDPLSPLLFNTVVDMLAILICRAKENGQISGVVPHLVDDGLSVLQYADDTIIFMKNNLDQTVNMKLLLCAFEQLSELKINFHKRIVLLWGSQEPTMHLLANFWVWYGNLPFQISRYPDAFSKAQKCRLERGGGKIPKEIMRLEMENALGWREISSHNCVLSNLSMYMFYFLKSLGKCSKN